MNVENLGITKFIKKVCDIENITEEQIKGTFNRRDEDAFLTDEEFDNLVGLTSEELENRKKMVLDYFLKNDETNLEKIAKKIIKESDYDYICINIDTEKLSPCFNDSTANKDEIIVKGVSDEDIIDCIYDSVSILDIAETAYSNWNRGFADGVVQYDYNNGVICGATMTQGTLENHETPVFEIYRISQNFEFESDNEDENIAQIEEDLYEVLTENIRDNCPEKYIIEAKEEELANRIERQLDALTELNLMKNEEIKRLENENIL